MPESNEQNLIVIEAFLEAAKRYARGGYDVIVDGIIGPWFLKPWQSLVREHYEVHYIILRASKEETLKRAVERSKLDRKTNIELVETDGRYLHGNCLAEAALGFGRRRRDSFKRSYLSVSICGKHAGRDRERTGIYSLKDFSRQVNISWRQSMTGASFLSAINPPCRSHYEN